MKCLFTLLIIISHQTLLITSNILPIFVYKTQKTLTKELPFTNHLFLIIW